MLIGTGCCNLTNYHTITTTTASHAEWPSWLIVIQSQVRKYIHMYFTRLGHHPGSVLIIFVPAVYTLYLLPKDLEQEFITFPEHLRSPLVYSGVHVTRSLVVCVCFVDRCLYFFSRPLGCLFFFDIRILITTLISETLFITARSAILYIVMN